MLYLTFKMPKKNCIYGISNAFKFIYNRDWFLDDFVQEMVLKIDDTQTTVVNNKPYLESNKFERGIEPEGLSGGVKALILNYKSDFSRQYGYVYPSSDFGDNCFPYLLKIAEEYGVVLFIDSYFAIPKYTGENRYGYEDDLVVDRGDFCYKFVVLDDGKEYNSYRDLFNIVFTMNGVE